MNIGLGVINNMGKKITLYHGTSAKNLDSIQEKGLEHRFEGIYLTDSIDSAQRWTSFRVQAQGESELMVVEVKVDESKLEEGCDHSPMMETIFGVGKSILHQGDIPLLDITEYHLFKITTKQK